ncbi:MAG: YeiH family protein [Acidimicrobiia bacterium]
MTVVPPGARTRSKLLPLAPGIALSAGIAAIAAVVHATYELASAQVVAVCVGVLLTNLGWIPSSCRSGLAFSAKHVMRAGIVLVGLRLSMGDVAQIGVRGFAAVVLVVTISFTGTRAICRAAGLSDPMSTLVATGYSICGVSAIAAAEPTVGGTEEEVAYAIGLVTLCGSLAIGTMPLLGSILGVPDLTLGVWIGASVHDVGQVVAAASVVNGQVLEAAVVIKLTRVLLLAPLLALLSIAARRHEAESPKAGAAESRAKLLPPFILMFLVAVALRTIGTLSRATLDAAHLVESFGLAMGLAGLASAVSVQRLRHLGARPLIAGLASWALVALASLVTAALLF